MSAIAATWTTTVPAERRFATDSEAMRRAQRGDEAARDELARLSRRTAFRFALQLTRDREAAADLAQEATLRLFGSLARIDCARPLEPWLLKVTRNLVRDRWRRSRLRPLAELPDDLVAEPEIHDPELRTARRERQRLVWAALSGLSAEAREIVVLRDYQDFQYAEIADILEIPVGTVMSRLHRARTELAARVRAELGGSQEVSHD